MSNDDHLYQLHIEPPRKHEYLRGALLGLLVGIAIGMMIMLAIVQNEQHHEDDHDHGSITVLEAF